MRHDGELRGATASRAKQFDGAVARDIQIDGAVALRPLGERWALLDKVSFRLEDARAGTSATLPLTRFTDVGDGRSRRLVNNLALNLVGRPWSPDDGGGPAEQRAQASLYWGTKYVFDRYDGADFDGFTQVIGAVVDAGGGTRPRSWYRVRCSCSVVSLRSCSGNPAPRSIRSPSPRPILA